MGKKAPKAPDPTAVARAQLDASTNAARTEAKLNRVNQTGPGGSLVYSQDPNDQDRWSANVTFSPQVQGAVDQEFGQYGSYTPDAVTTSMLDRLRPYQERERMAMETRLANQGIGLGSTASNAAWDDYWRGTNDANLAAVSQGAQLATQQQNAAAQRLQSLYGLGTGTQVDVPGISIAAPDITSVYNNNYTQRSNQYTANMAALREALGTGGKIAGAYFGGG